MVLLSETLKLLGFTLGAALHAFLSVVVFGKRGRSVVDRLILAALVSAGFWHACHAYPRLYDVLSGRTMESFTLLSVGSGALLLALAFLLHASVAWAGLSNWLAAPIYAASAAAWWLGDRDRPEVYRVWVLLATICVAALCVQAARARVEAHERRFFYRISAALLLIPAAGWAADADSATIVVASLASPSVFAYYIYRYNLFGLLIGKRVVFALELGVFFAVYLTVVRAVASYLGEMYGIVEEIVEVIFILAATLIGLPLYGLMTRFLSKRTQLYADFSKRLIEETARILDLQKRLQFIAEEVARTFGLRRVVLATAGESPVRGEYGMGTAGQCREPLDVAKDITGRLRADVYHRDRTTSPEMRKLLADCGFNYLFPLRYEGNLIGFLLLDTSPRLFLDENEAILLGLSRQISHSIETCRVVEDKIGLERALARQEHLATLGKVAATIAHEIKNPLSSVKTLAQLMREDPEVRGKYDRDLGYMIDETDRLNRSVLQLLSFSRPLPEQRQDVDLSDLLETMGQMLERQCAGEQIRIERQIAPGLWLRGSNPEIVKQVVLNLALNAVQASEAKGMVRLEAEAQGGGKIRVAVSDQGPGIPVEIREKIFEPFFTTKQRGTGLGLAIVRKHVRHLGGEMVIESPVMEGRGTRMVVTLPAV